VNQCSSDWQTCCGASGSDNPSDYDTMVSSCTTAGGDMGNVQAFFAGASNNPSGEAFSAAVSSLGNTSQYLSSLPSNAVRPHASLSGTL
jgi:hypothetical protein